MHRTGMLHGCCLLGYHHPYHQLGQFQGTCTWGRLQLQWHRSGASQTESRRQSQCLSFHHCPAEAREWVEKVPSLDLSGVLGALTSTAFVMSACSVPIQGGKGSACGATGRRGDTKREFDASHERVANWKSNTKPSQHRNCTCSSCNATTDGAPSSVAIVLPSALALSVTSALLVRSPGKFSTLKIAIVKSFCPAVSAVGPSRLTLDGPRVNVGVSVRINCRPNRLIFTTDARKVNTQSARKSCLCANVKVNTHICTHAHQMQTGLAHPEIEGRLLLYQILAHAMFMRLGQATHTKPPPQRNRIQSSRPRAGQSRVQLVGCSDIDC
jgi:hypothetical protein